MGQITKLPFLLVLLLTLATGCSTTEQSAQNDNTQAPAPADERPEEPSGSDADDIEPTVVGYEDADFADPLMGFNRAIFAFNDVSYRYVLIPLARGYTGSVPSPVRQSLGNFYFNIHSPIYLVNNLLQLKARKAGNNLLRFGINSTLGLLGFFDPARHWFSLERADTGLSDTLAQYGVGYGAYLVLPFMGSSDLRSGGSTIVENAMSPIGWIFDGRDRVLIQGFGNFQAAAPRLLNYSELLEDSEDPYLFMRNLYMQNLLRDAEFPEDSADDVQTGED